MIPNFENCLLAQDASCFSLAENMVICLEDQHTGRCLKGGPSGDKNYTIKMYNSIDNSNFI